MLAPAMPVVMQNKKLFIGLFGLAVNSEFHYPNYFVMIPSGPDPKPAFTQGLLRGRDGAEPEAEDRGDRRRRPGILAQRLGRRAQNAKKYGLKIVYDKTYPPSTTDLLADRPRDPGDQPGHRGGVLLSARLGRHRACRQRGRLQAEDDRRRHGRPAEHRHQGAARPAAQRHRQLRLLAAGAEDDVPGRRRT